MDFSSLFGCSLPVAGPVPAVGCTGESIAHSRTATTQGRSLHPDDAAQQACLGSARARRERKNDTTVSEKDQCLNRRVGLPAAPAWVSFAASDHMRKTSMSTNLQVLLANRPTG